MSPFFRGSVRPPRKHPRPWSLNPRLNPDIAKDGHDARASFYDVGTKEGITLPVHNGVYRDAAEKTVGLEPRVVNAVSEIEKEEQPPSPNDSSPLVGSIGVARAAEVSGWETVADQVEEEEPDEAFLTARTEKTETQLFGLDDHLRAPMDEQSEVVNVENPEEQSREETEVNAVGTAPALSGIGIPETSEPATEALPVVESTIDIGNSSEVPSLPTESKNIETAGTLTPHAAEHMEAKGTEETSGSSQAEFQPVKIDESKWASGQPSSAVKVVPVAVEEPAIAHPDVAPQPEALSARAGESPTSDGMDTVEAPVAQSEVPAQTSEAGASSVEQESNPPLEQYQMLDEEPGSEAREGQAETDNESAAEAPFVPDHRHTPPSSRKPSQGEEPLTMTVAHHVDEPQTGVAAAAKSVEGPHVEPASVEGSIANEEPLMSDEQLNVSDEFRPGVKINSDAEPAAGARVESD